MLRLADIEDAWMNDAKANITGVKTAETHETEFDDALLTALLPRAPFVLFRYGGTVPDEDERHADGSSGINERRFTLTIGAESLRSKKEAQRGCYDLLDDLRERYDGFRLTVGSSSITLNFDGDTPWSSGQGLVTYKQLWRWDEN